MNTVAASLLNWSPSPFIAASLSLHAGALILLLLASTHWAWALAVVLLNQAVITVAGLWPRSTLLGANLVRLPAVAAQRGEIVLTFDDGPDPEVTPKVLRILKQYQARATFFCIGEKAAAYPGICRSILAHGHTIENHGQRHRNLTAFSGVGGWMREIGDAQETLERICGRRPQFFRALAGLRNPFLDPALHLSGLRLASWTRRGYDTQCGDADIVLARLAHGLAAGDILLLHDGSAARSPNGTPVILEVLPRLLDELAARDLHSVPLDIACNPN